MSKVLETIQRQYNTDRNSGICREGSVSSIPGIKSGSEAHRELETNYRQSDGRDNLGRTRISTPRD